MEKLFSIYLNAGFFGSVMILLILLLRPLLCKAPRNVLCILWLLVAVRLLLPFSLESKLSLQPQYTPYQPAVTTPVEEPDALPEPTPVVPDTQIVPELPPVVPDTPPTPAPVDPEPLPDRTPEIRQPINYMRIISAVWFGGIGAVLLYAVVSYHILKYKVRDAVRCKDGTLVSDRIHGAFLLGYFNPKIYLPIGLSQQDRQFIIAHELVHMRRGDNWWKLLGLFCACVHWYNPLVWLSYVLLCRDIEVACDERVIRSMPLEERKAYSFALLNSGKRMSEFFVYPVAFGEVSLKQRIKNVLSYRKAGFWITAVSIVLVVFVAVCFMTSPEADLENDIQSYAPETESTSPNEQEITKPSTEPTTEPTAPPATQPTAPTVTTPTEPPITEPTEPPVIEPTEPPITEPPATKPNKPTEPPATTPNQEQNSGVTVIDGGKRDGGPVTWKVTSDGVLTISGNRSIQGSASYVWKNYSDMITKIVVEDGITAIPQNAFSGMDKVTSVYLSSSLETIYKEAFFQCTALQSVTIPAGVKEIPQYAFYGCSSLATLKFAPNCKIETIGQYAFSKTGITSFSSPASLRVIDSNAFEGCESLKAVILQGGVEELRAYSFANCTNLKHITLGESITYMEETFHGCLAIETAEIYTDHFNSLVARKALKSVVIGGNVTAIRDAKFEGCTALSSVTINAPITEIWMDAFLSCKSLTSITLPNTVTSIGGGAFFGSGLTKITIPASVTEIHTYVFANSSVEEITFVGEFPAFMPIEALDRITATVYYPADNATWAEADLEKYGEHITWIAQ